MHKDKLIKELIDLVEAKKKAEELNYEDIGEKIGVAGTTVSRFIIGKIKDTKLSTFFGLADFCGLELSLPGQNRPDAKSLAKAITDVEKLLAATKTNVPPEHKAALITKIYLSITSGSNQPDIAQMLDLLSILPSLEPETSD